MKTFFALTAVFFLLLSANAEGADQTQKTEKFQASSLWGIRRGPNAPKATVSEEDALKESNQKKMKDAQQAYYEQQAKEAYLSSQLRPSGGSSSGASSPAADVSCALEKKS